jgi:hypothetical protein
MKISQHLPKRITRRGIQIALGILWLLDGLLQLQHQMFSSNFATQVIAPAGQGQPIPVYGPINFEIHMLLLHPALFNAIFAAIQIALGILILYRKTVRVGLSASVVWGLAVWWMGEGFGGLLSGQTSILLGAPGAALLYVLIALAIFPKKETKSKEQHTPAYWLPAVWAVLWLMGAIYQLLPGQNSAADVASTIAGNAGGGTPGWLSSLDIHTANFIHGKGVSFVILIAAVQATIGILVLAPGKVRRVAIYVGIALSLAFWIVGQSLGAYFTGLATDPSTAPLFILLGVAILGTNGTSYKLLKRDIATLVARINTIQAPKLPVT